MNPYIRDILSQPVTLRLALEKYSISLLRDIDLSEYDRIVISGMGSSYYAAYPAVIQLSGLPVPVQWINAAELLHSRWGAIGERTLLWLNSQSGRSAEPVHLLERLHSSRPARVLAFVNDLSSPMAERADIAVPIHAGEEATVSTKTYINMLAVNLLAAVQLAGGDVGALVEEMRRAADAMQDYLADWQSRVQELGSLLGDFDELFLIGRGASLSAVWNGSLINKEAAKCAFEGMHAADFRHGPLELAAKGLAALIFAGSFNTSTLNRELGREIRSHGGKVIWVDSAPDDEIPTLPIPFTTERTLPLVEILPVQMLTLVMAQRKGIEPGRFRHVSKVTARE